MIEKQVDILIIGAGLTGASLQCALMDKGFEVLLIDSNPFDPDMGANFDARSLALSPASVNILKMLSIWPLLSAYATPIQSIHVSDQHGFGATRLDAPPNQPHGYVVEMQYINQALRQRLSLANVLAPVQVSSLNKDNGVCTLMTTEGKTIRVYPKLVVAADGSDSVVRQWVGLGTKEKAYHQYALVANIELARPHGFKAFERFTSTGPLALLPMTGHRVALIWAQNEEETQRLATLPEREFIIALQRAFGYRLGRFLKVGRRVIFPLRQIIMPQQIQWPFVFVGNAAHTLHPVAGQGFNLGLRDVATLAQCIIQKGLNASMLNDYEALRRHDQQAIIRLTDGLITLFSNRSFPLRLARTLGLIAMDNLSAFKKGLRHYASGFAGTPPDLVCGIELETNDS